MLNHIAFVKKCTELLNTYQGVGSIYLFYADFSEFKLINYYYGIEKGDELLDAVIGFVRNIPEVAYCERIFSDQFIFLVLAKEKRTNEEIIASYNDFAEAFLKTQRDKYPACNLKFCCGIASIEDHNVIAAIDNANMARLDAKKLNASTAVLFTKTKLEELAELQEQEKEIMLALREKRFVFYLQPKVDLLTGQIVGAEALARRLKPDGTVVFPDSFISILEENGAIVELDYMIFEQVCRHMSDRLKRGFPVVCTSVNLSRLHIQNKETAAKYHAIAKKYNVPPKFLEFELTESVILQEFWEVKILGDRLRAYGYSTSVDDFGSGYTGINIFQNFNFDVLKLDKKFLSDDVDIKARNAVIIPSIIDIAQKLNIEVICEGVERIDQCQCLLELGCRYAQGFYFSQAVPPDMFYKIYHDQKGRYPLPLHVELSEN